MNKHGLASSHYQPNRADWTIDQNWHSYTAQDHSVWRTLFERQTQLLQTRACPEFIQGMQDLPMSAHEIPNFQALSQVLMARTGWQVLAVPGLIPDDVFFDHLANRRFPAGQFIRKPHELDYLEEPDVFHDVFGHVPMLMNPVMGDFIQAYGKGGLKAKALGQLHKLARIYWYTVEFGLVQTTQGIRIYGAGIASSRTESVFALDSSSPNRLGFNIPRLLQTRYRIDDFQESYFVLPHLDALLQLEHIDFAPLYQTLEQQSEYEPGQVLSTDTVLHQGDGHYHAQRRAHAS